MNRFERALYGALQAALMPVQVYALQAEQGHSSTYVTYRRISSNRQTTTTQAICTVESRIELGVFGNSYASVRSAAATAIAALHGFRGQWAVTGEDPVKVQSVRLANDIDEPFNEATQRHSARLDFIVWYEDQ